jgi:membrane associated rhomboid family serine protease
VIPLRDLNPTTRRAVVTVVLLLLNVGVYFLVQVQQSGNEQVEARDPDTGRTEQILLPAELSFTLEYAAVPCEITDGEPLTVDEIVQSTRGDDTACGDDSGTQLFPDKSVWLAIVTSMFLHGGLLHIAGNMLFLWIFGNNVEDRLGPAWYLVFYLAGGVAAAIAHVAAQPDSAIPVVGASGAIAAVMGAYLVWYPRAPIKTLIFMFFVFFVEVRAAWLLLGWFLLQFFTAEGSGVAWVAHVGGFVFGVLVALLLRRRQAQPRPVEAFRF